MNKKVNLLKDKRPKRKRHKTDDGLFVARGHEVEAVQENNKTTSEKGVTADFPELENLGWMFDNQVKDSQSLLKKQKGQDDANLQDIC